MSKGGRRVISEVRRRGTVAASPQRIWPAIGDAPSLASLLERVEQVEPVDDGWRWTIEPLSGAGYTVEPRFTTSFEVTPPERVTLTHRPDPGSSVEAGGGVTVAARGEASEVTFHLRIDLELDVPRVLVPAIRRLLDHGLDRLGADFLHELDRRVRDTDDPPQQRRDT